MKESKINIGISYSARIPWINVTMIISHAGSFLLSALTSHFQMTVIKKNPKVLRLSTFSQRLHVVYRYWIINYVCSVHGNSCCNDFYPFSLKQIYTECPVWFHFYKSSVLVFKYRLETRSSKETKTDVSLSMEY